MKYDYWFGPDEEDRRIEYVDSFKPEYQENGDDTQRRIEAVVVAFEADTGLKLPHGYSSGWRPDVVNEATSNAGKQSKHLSANAGDKRDLPNGEYAWWCFRHPEVMEQHGLWMEHPVATVLRAYRTAREQDRTPTPWCHQQRVPPGSGLRVYFPDTASVREWEEFTKAGGTPGLDYIGWMTITAPAKPKGKKRKEDSSAD